ncbi:MAG TPA: metallophosphoesterase family protein [Candidatus Omnitrophota bacterium]|nr:metallophosphoesterase family protein [Candidatus Omnitrophota bacterium]
MRHAVFADIHGNLEALQAAIAYAQKQHLSRFLVLGDSVGYGANPNECLEWAFQYATYHVLGNHEAAILQESIRSEFTDWARVAIDWTAEKLHEGLAAKIKDLPYRQIQDTFTLAHGTIHAPERFDYLLDPSKAHNSFLAMQTRVGFVGHSHIPCVFTEKSQESRHLSDGVFQLKKDERYLLNPGSIGQPRDRDTRLSFGIFDGDELTFEIVRLPYDNKTAAQKIRKEGLPKFLADRLL